MTSHNDFILYSYWRSSASYRVRIALNLKKIQYEYRAVHLLNNGGEQHSPEYTKLNPSRDVPTLVHKGRAIGQSVAILDYLDRIEAYQPLFPQDPVQRALVLQACEIINSGSQPLLNVRVHQRLESMFGMNEDQKKTWSREWAEYGLRSLENLLKPHAGTYSFGETVSAADCFLVPHTFTAARFGANLDDFPLIKRIRDNCAKLEAFAKAAPNAQPDTPAENR